MKRYHLTILPALRRSVRRLGGVLLAGATLGTILTSAAVAAPDVAVGIPFNEPHTAAVRNPQDPKNVIVSGLFEMRISNDFGLTFPIQVLPTIPAGHVPAGDSVLTFDAQGRLFWTYLIFSFATGDLSVVVQQVNPRTGAKIGDAVDVTPGNNFDDKQWIVADTNPSSPFANNLYLVWTRFGPGPLQVMFSRSTNHGLTWSRPAVISDSAVEGFVWPSHVAVAPDGDLYAAYHGDTCGSPLASMFVLRDTTGGARLAAGAPVQKSSFRSAITCNVQDLKDLPRSIPQTDFWMQGASAPYVLPDPQVPGRIYVVANDDPNNLFGNGDDGDVVLARSTDFGRTWSVSTISQGPAGSLQAFPTGAFDEDDNLMVFWYDTRSGLTNAAGNFLLDVFATVSKDGGETFSDDFRINDRPFDPDLGAPIRFFGPPPTRRIGEYNGAAAAMGVGYAAWTGNTAFGQQILFDVFSIPGAFPDRFEPNNTMATATDLASTPDCNLPDLTIHNGTDEDFYRVVAPRTGQMTFQITLKGRVSDLDIQVLDESGSILGWATPGLDLNDLEGLTIPVVQGQTLFVRVFAEPGQVPAHNTYELNIPNLPCSSTCAILTDSTGTQIQIGSAGTVPSIICHGEAVICGEAFSVCAGRTFAAGAQNNTLFNLLPSASGGPFHLCQPFYIPAPGAAPVFLKPVGGSGITFNLDDPNGDGNASDALPEGTLVQVVLENLPTPGNCLGVRTTIQHRKGTCKIWKVRKFFNTCSDPVTITQLKEFELPCECGIFSSGFGPGQSQIAVASTQSGAFITLQGTGNTGANSGNAKTPFQPSAAGSVGVASFNAEIHSCFLTEGFTAGKVDSCAPASQRWLEVFQSFFPGGVKLEGARKAGSEKLVTFHLDIQ
jgi:hypothetical protein